MIDLRGASTLYRQWPGQRDVALRGADAARYVELRGWSPPPPADFRIVGDTIRGPSMGLSRYRHSSFTAVLPAMIDNPTDEPVVALSLMVAGEARIGAPGAQVVCPPGSAVLLDPSPSIHYSTEGATMSITLSLVSAVLRETLGGLSQGPLILTVETAAGRLLTSTLTAIFDSQLEYRSPSFPEIRRAISRLVVAIAIDSSAKIDADRSSGTGFGMLLRARSLIASEVSKPGFDVKMLAARLGVSASTAHSVFAAVGSSPAQEIRRMRARIVEDLLRDGNNRLSQRELVQKSGFGSLRSLQRALAERL